MPEYTIPRNPGVFRVVTALGGNALVINDRNGKNAVRIPCKSREQAEQLCQRLNSGDHPGRVRAYRPLASRMNIPLFGERAIQIIADHKIAAALAAGEFDKLPGLGRPHAIFDEPYAPDWWVRRRLRELARPDASPR